MALGSVWSSRLRLRLRFSEAALVCMWVPVCQSVPCSLICALVEAPCPAPSLSPLFHASSPSSCAPQPTPGVAWVRHVLITPPPTLPPSPSFIIVLPLQPLYCLPPLLSTHLCATLIAALAPATTGSGNAVENTTARPLFSSSGRRRLLNKPLPL